MAETILQKIVERGHYKFVDRVDSWQEGVRLSCESLVKTGDQCMISHVTSAW